VISEYLREHREDPVGELIGRLRLPSVAGVVRRAGYLRPPNVRRESERSRPGRFRVGSDDDERVFGPHGVMDG
jgi:hypothetical protein